VIAANYVHPTAIVEEGVALGAGTRVWDNVHIRHGARIGAECIIGEKSYIAYDVAIGDRVKINAFVYVCAGVTIESGAMISAGVIFTNDRFPRAAASDLSRLRSSDPDEHTQETRICAGATIGAGARIGSGLVVGRYAMVGMGAIVTKSVPAHHLVVGTPARSAGLVCRCGEPLARSAVYARDVVVGLRCSACRDQYTVDGFDVTLTGSS
jgi:UDP-2-acetamido-3-amino-2,3-dideoxy-glucuronate N-acetyltransferase